MGSDALNQSPEPTAASLSVWGRGWRFAAPWLRRVLSLRRLRLSSPLSLMKSLSIKVAALAVTVLIVNGCAYFRPSETESERLAEQRAIHEQEEYGRTLAGGLMKAAAGAAGVQGVGGL